jgi:D-alanyl-D-alanine dipeptidase
MSSFPEGFVCLNELEDSIQYSLRYATTENFMGEIIPGYHSSSSKILCTLPCSRALVQIQNLVKQDGYSLVIYDTYRPQKAVNRFMCWSKEFENQKRKTQYYPYVDKEKVFELGYIAEKSGHSRGSTVDLTLIPLDQQVSNSPRCLVRQEEFLDGIERPYLDDNTLDMGTSFDLFDIASHHDSSVIGEPYKRRRDYLRRIMEENGFLSCEEEWWHYTLKDEPFPDSYFDF